MIMLENVVILMNSDIVVALRNSIVIIGAFIGVDRLLYLHEKYINWKTGRKKS